MQLGPTTEVAGAIRVAARTAEAVFFCIASAVFATRMKHWINLEGKRSWE